MSPDPTTTPASPPSGNSGQPETKTFIVAKTKRARFLGPGVEVTPMAGGLRQHRTYSVNFRQKSQDEVHVKLPGADAYAVFRFEGGQWANTGVVANGHPTTAPPHDITFALYALLLMRKDAELEDRIVKPDPYALVRKITDEEREICKRIGRPPNLRSRAAYMHVQPLLHLIKEDGAP